MRASRFGFAILLVSISFAFILNGCISASYGGVNQKQQANILKGKTTKVEILRVIGNPDQTIDLGRGEEELSYVREEYSATSLTSKNTEFWLKIRNGVVEDFGERPTTKAHRYGALGM